MKPHVDVFPDKADPTLFRVESNVPKEKIIQALEKAVTKGPHATRLLEYINGPFSNPGLEERRLKMLEEVKDLSIEELAARRQELVKLRAEKNFEIKRIEQFNVLENWLLIENHELQRNEHTKLHLLVDAVQNDKAMYLDDLNAGDPNLLALPSTVLDDMSNIQTFLVQHNWAAAFEGAENFAELPDEELTVPYPCCAFEFRITGRTVIGITHQQKSGIRIAFFVELPENGWYFVGFDRASMGAYPGLALAWQHIRAVCIALESQAATYEHIPAPAKLNKKRATDGKLPIYSHHLIDLSKKYRSYARSTSASAGTTGRHVRLHFRRRHKRHYRTGLVIQIEWMLVGDPDLGFVDKTYRLR